MKPLYYIVLFVYCLFILNNQLALGQVPLLLKPENNAFLSNSAFAGDKEGWNIRGGLSQTGVSKNPYNVGHFGIDKMGIGNSKTFNRFIWGVKYVGDASKLFEDLSFRRNFVGATVGYSFISGTANKRGNLKNQGKIRISATIDYTQHFSTLVNDMVYRSQVSGGSGIAPLPPSVATMNIDLPRGNLVGAGFVFMFVGNKAREQKGEIRYPIERERRGKSDTAIVFRNTGKIGETRKRTEQDTKLNATRNAQAKSFLGDARFFLGAHGQIEGKTGGLHSVSIQFGFNPGNSSFAILSFFDMQKSYLGNVFYSKRLSTGVEYAFPNVDKSPWTLGCNVNTWIASDNIYTGSFFVRWKVPYVGITVNMVPIAVGKYNAGPFYQGVDIALKFNINKKNPYRCPLAERPNYITTIMY